MNGQTIQTIAYALLALGQLLVFGKYVYQGLIAWRDKNKAEAAFISDMKRVVIPHIYETLKALCFYNNIPYEEPKHGGYTPSNTRAD